MKKIVEKTAGILIKEATYNELLNRVAKLEADAKTKATVGAVDILMKELSEMKAENIKMRAENARIIGDNTKIKADNATLTVRLTAIEKELETVRKELVTLKEINAMMLAMLEKLQVDMNKLLKMDNSDLIKMEIRKQMAEVQTVSMKARKAVTY